MSSWKYTRETQNPKIHSKGPTPAGEFVYFCLSCAAFLSPPATVPRYGNGILGMPAPSRAGEVILARHQCSSLLPLGRDHQTGRLAHLQPWEPVPTIPARPALTPLPCLPTHTPAVPIAACLNDKQPEIKVGLCHFPLPLADSARNCLASLARPTQSRLSTTASPRPPPIPAIPLPLPLPLTPHPSPLAPRPSPWQSLVSLSS